MRLSDGYLLVVISKKSTVKLIDFIMDKKDWILRKFREINSYRELSSNGSENKLLLYERFYDLEIRREENTVCRSSRMKLQFMFQTEEIHTFT